MPATTQALSRRSSNDDLPDTPPATESALWRSDFSEIPPRERRLARFVLGAHPPRSGPVGRWSHLGDGEPARLALLLPLIDPDALAAWASERQRRLEPETVNLLTGNPLPAHPELDDGDLRLLLKHLLRHGLARTRKRLLDADGRAPVSPTVTLLVECLSLDPVEAQVLDYLDHTLMSETFRELLRGRPRVPGGVNRERLAKLLRIPVEQLAARLTPRAPLRLLGLVDYEMESDLEDFLTPTELLRQVMDAAPATIEALLGLLVEPAPAAQWSLEDFPHLDPQSAHLATALGEAAATRAVGINALLYGPPGTGKTELARAAAADRGLRAFQVRGSDEEGEGLMRRGRLSAYLLAQRLLARRDDAILIFDEVEDVFESEQDLLALLRGRPSGHQKAWINRILETNPVPAIWITNDTDGMDPAFLRRFLLPLGFRTPPRSARRRMAERHLGGIGVSRELLDALAADEGLTPASLDAAKRLVALRPDLAPDQVAREVIAAQRTLLLGAPMPWRRQSATVFDAAFLNLDADIAPGRIVTALQRHGRGSLCFYGPPGTGKTQFAEALAEGLDRELIARQASDLISPYVGETEQNLARLFANSDPAHTVVLLDEVDSFLADRRGARHSWERTRVNELLQQMERYPGIFIAATNLMSGIDAAALRRFDFKLQFKPLDPAQRRALFAREVFGDSQAELPDALARHLDALAQLTAGDFANVCRQRSLLGETLTPEQFLRRLIAECRLKARQEALSA
jgi:SpoVK/Ycf46/Vps4 family AAA+-type ATPase